MLKALIFDFGQTLVDSSTGFKKAEKELQTIIFTDLNLPSWEEFLHLYRKIRSSFHEKQDFSRYHIITRIYEQYCQEIDRSIARLWEKRYWEIVLAMSKLFPETLSVLKKLEKKYILAVITNTQGESGLGVHRINAFPELSEHFKVIVVAGEDEIPAKPHPMPFHTCLNNLQLNPDEALFIGDDWEIDICGARNVGIEPIWLKHHTLSRRWPKGEEEVLVIHELDALLEIEKFFS